jgi:hypothetical protein
MLQIRIFEVNQLKSTMLPGHATRWQALLSPGYGRVINEHGPGQPCPSQLPESRSPCAGGWLWQPVPTTRLRDPSEPRRSRHRPGVMDQLGLRRAPTSRTGWNSDRLDVQRSSSPERDLGRRSSSRDSVGYLNRLAEEPVLRRGLDRRTPSPYSTLGCSATLTSRLFEVSVGRTSTVVSAGLQR